MAPFFQPAKMFGTFTKGLVSHRLKSIKMLPALGASILVGWHGKIAELQSRCVQKQNSSPPAFAVGFVICRRPEPGHSLTLKPRYGTSSAIDETGEQNASCRACWGGLHDLYGRLRRGPPLFHPNPISWRSLWPRTRLVRRPAGQCFLLGRRGYERKAEREN